MSRQQDSTSHEPNIEQELKYALSSKADWERVCATLPGFEGEFQQRNSYWDTPAHALQTMGATLRLRIEETSKSSRAFVTLKTGKRRTDGCFVADEFEAPVELQAGIAIYRGLAPLGSLECRVLARVAALPLDIQQLRCWGQLENLRRCYRVTDALRVEVDHSVLLNPRATAGRRSEEFWEVELECTEVARARELLTRLLAASQARFAPQTMTKAERLARFLAASEASR